MNYPILFPKMKIQLEIMGENIKLARLRRKYTIEQVCERASITSETLSLIESGYPNITLGQYLSVLKVLGLDNDIYTIASNDILGRKLQDIALLGSEG
jgi:transcriptional regulator with XRE-family HTH domain